MHHAAYVPFSVTAQLAVLTDYCLCSAVWLLSDPDSFPSGTLKSLGICSHPILSKQSCVRERYASEEEFHKLRPATRLITCANLGNDVVCSSIWTVYNVIPKPQMVLLSKKGAYGVSARREKVCMLLPQRSQGGTLKNHMLFIASRTTVASQTNLVSPVYMASAKQPVSRNWQAMTAQPKLQKWLHAPPRNRKVTIPPTLAIRLKPLLVHAYADA